MYNAQRNELPQFRLSNSAEENHTASACRLVLQDHVGKHVQVRRILGKGFSISEFSQNNKKVLEGLV